MLRGMAALSPRLWMDGIAWCAVAALLGGCASPRPPEPALANPPGDLLIEARRWTEEDGRRAACERLRDELAGFDDSGGMFERRLMRTNADKSFRFADSVARMPRAERRRTGIYFILGFNQDRGRSPPIIKRAAERLAEEGFRAQVLEVPGRRTADQNALMAREFLADELPRVDRAILIGFSKGAADLVEFWLDEADKLPRRELRKIRCWVNFAGALRGSEVARWLATDRGPKAAVFRGFVNLKAGTPSASFDDLASIASDPWFVSERRMPAGLAPGFLVINVVVVPDGPEGWSESDPLFETLGRAAASGRRPIGPCDGLVESASSVLPPRAGLRQWVVRITGSHATLDGVYLNGSPVTTGYGNNDEAQLDSGTPLMDDFLRALPRRVIDGSQRRS
jgi:hypothetical protein